MLVTTLDHAAGNDYLAARFQKAYAFLNRDDLGSLPLGRVDIDGDAVFANVQEYDTVPAEEKQLEAHRVAMRGGEAVGGPPPLLRRAVRCVGRGGHAVCAARRPRESTAL